MHNIVDFALSTLCLFSWKAYPSYNDNTVTGCLQLFLGTPFHTTCRLIQVQSGPEFAPHKSSTGTRFM